MLRSVLQSVFRHCGHIAVGVAVLVVRVAVGFAVLWSYYCSRLQYCGPRCSRCCSAAVGVALLRSVLRLVLRSVLLCCSPYSGRCSVDVVRVAASVAVMRSVLRCCGQYCGRFCGFVVRVAVGVAVGVAGLRRY